MRIPGDEGTNRGWGLDILWGGGGGVGGGSQNEGPVFGVGVKGFKIAPKIRVLFWCP